MPEQAIDYIVAAYVRVRDRAGLKRLRAHRLDLLSHNQDRDGYSFEVVRTKLQEDLTAVDEALNRGGEQTHDAG